MAPPEKRFPVGELEKRVHLYDKDYKERSRKLPKDFELKRDCELYELVQYSCTTREELEERQLHQLSGVNNPQAQLQCYPFVRLFRRCKFGNQEFNVETTAWEGRHKWTPSKRLLDEQAAEEARTREESSKQNDDENGNVFARYGSYFWSGK